MEVELKFNSKSTAGNIKKALRIANELNGQLSSEEKNIMIVKSNEFNKTLLQLMQLVQGLSKTDLFVDSEEIDNIPFFMEVINCKIRNYCKGLCQVYWWNWKDIFQALKIIAKPEDDTIFTIDESTFDFLNDPNLIIERNNNKEFIIDRDALVGHYKQHYKYADSFCNKFKKELLEKLEQFPEQIKVEVIEYDMGLGEYTEDSEADEDEPIDKAVFINITDEDISRMAIIFADELENRMRNVLNEYFKK